MSANLKSLEVLTSQDLEKREIARREAVASARIEGGAVSPEAQAILADWAKGFMDNATMVARINALDDA